MRSPFQGRAPWRKSGRGSATAAASAAGEGVPARAVSTGQTESGTPESGTAEPGTPESGTAESGTHESSTAESGTAELDAGDHPRPAAGQGRRRRLLGRGDAAGRDRLARALIDEAYGMILRDRQEAVAAAAAELAAAQRTVTGLERDLARMQRSRLHWRRWHRLDDAAMADRVVALRAVTVAQLADLADTDVPPGEHLLAVREYLLRHQPPEPPPAAPASDAEPAPEAGRPHASG